MFNEKIKFIAGFKTTIIKKKYAKSHSDVQETSSIFHRPGNEIDFPM